MTFDAFDTVTIQTSRTSIFARWGGSGPPVLLLHGFPETHLMWRTVAARLAREFTVVCPDLPGYGRSGCPASAADHAPYAKRAMARAPAGLRSGRGGGRRARRLGFGRRGVRSRRPGGLCGGAERPRARARDLRGVPGRGRPGPRARRRGPAGRPPHRLPAAGPVERRRPAR